MLLRSDMKVILFLFLVQPIPTIREAKYDAVTLYGRPDLAARFQLLDDGSGTIEKYILIDRDFFLIPKEKNTIFFSSECYIIKYTYNTPAGTYVVLYSWLVNCEIKLKK